MKVVAGQVSSITLDPQEQTVTVYTITPVPQYNSTLKTNDIALLKVWIILIRKPTFFELTIPYVIELYYSIQQLSADIVFDYVSVDFVAYNELDNGLPAVIMGWGSTFVS